MIEPFVSEQPGITSRHVFSAGAHYDPQRLALGAVVGCDEHLLAPGAGFDWHAHRGVHIVSIVLAGRLRHRGDDGSECYVAAGGGLVQSTGDGVRHAESNASDATPLRFVQTTILADGVPAVTHMELPVSVAGVGFDLLRGVESIAVPGDGFGLVLAGEFLEVGDAALVSAGFAAFGETVLRGRGDVLLVTTGSADDGVRRPEH